MTYTHDVAPCFRKLGEFTVKYYKLGISTLESLRKQTAQGWISIEDFEKVSGFEFSETGKLKAIQTPVESTSGSDDDSATKPVNFWAPDDKG